MSKRLRLELIGLALCLAFAAPAMADTLTETFTFPSFAGYVEMSGTSFPEFNPALGTLNSITLNATATATFSGGGPFDDNLAEYDIILNGVFFFMEAPSVGNGTAGAFSDLTSTFEGDLAALTGSGSVTTEVSVRNIHGTPASISSTFGTESLTYNFTPAATAAPEPEPLPVLGAILGLGMMVAARRRKVC